MVREDLTLKIGLENNFQMFETYKNNIKKSQYHIKFDEEERGQSITNVNQIIKTYK